VGTADSSGLDEAEAEPEQLVSAAPVAHITRDVGSFGVGDGARIEVFVPTETLAQVLAALDGGSVLSVVGAPGAVGAP